MLDNDAATAHLLHEIRSLPSPTTPESGMVEAEMLSAAGMEVDDPLGCDTCDKPAVWSITQGYWWCPRCCLRVVSAAASLPVLRDGDSAIDRALRGRCWISMF